MGKPKADVPAEAVRLAAEMKAGCLVVYSGGRAGHTHNHARRLVKEALKELEDSSVLKLMYRSILVTAPHKLRNDHFHQVVRL